MEKKTGKVLYVTKKFSGGLKLESDPETWLNGTKDSKAKITADLKGQEVEIVLDDKGKISDIKSLGIDTPPTQPIQVNGNKDAKIIRQCCIKAAASAFNINVDDGLPSVSFDAMIALAKRMEKFVNG